MANNNRYQRLYEEQNNNLNSVVYWHPDNPVRRLGAIPQITQSLSIPLSSRDTISLSSNNNTIYAIGFQNQTPIPGSQSQQVSGSISESFQSPIQGRIAGITIFLRSDNNTAPFTSAPPPYDLNTVRVSIYVDTGSAFIEQDHIDIKVPISATSNDGYFSGYKQMNISVTEQQKIAVIVSVADTPQDNIPNTALIDINCLIYLS